MCSYLNWCPSMKKRFRKIQIIFDMENWLLSQILAPFDTFPLHQFSKFKDFFRVCWFLGKSLSKFVPPGWKLDNKCYHTGHAVELTLSLASFLFIGTIHKRRLKCFQIFDTPLSYVGSFLVLSIGNFNQFLTPLSPLHCVFKWILRGHWSQRQVQQCQPCLKSFL